jgi:hypothetical protein
MNWYLAKLVYRIICGDGCHTPQFDEQLRLIHAYDDLHAFQKAQLIGDKEQETFLNTEERVVQWKFINVCELHRLDELTDGAEMYSHIYEQNNPEIYLRTIKSRANYLFEESLQCSIKLN